MSVEVVSDAALLVRRGPAPAATGAPEPVSLTDPSYAGSACEETVEVFVGERSALLIGGHIRSVSRNAHRCLLVRV